jgi:hypothetical protein
MQAKAAGAELATTVPATNGAGAKVDLGISGNVASSQISNATITSYPPTKTTTVSFTIAARALLSSEAFYNMTIPKTAVYHGTSPVVYIDGLQASQQGYTQDANSFYVWFTTIQSLHHASIQFAVSPILLASVEPVLVVSLTVPEVISVFTVIAIRRLRQKPENA